MKPLVPRIVRQGFSIIELIVVIAIIGILVALLMVGVSKVRSASSRASCRSQLHQLGTALDLYYDTQKPFPDAAQLPSVTPQLPSLPRVLGSFVDDTAKVFQCPSDRSYFTKEGISYEYPATTAGRTREELTLG